MPVFETYEEYLAELNKKLSRFERLADSASGIDERLDLLARLSIENLKLLREGLKVQYPPPLFPELPHYNVLKFLLDTARPTPGDEIEMPGDMITAFTDGTLAGTYIRLDSPTADAIPLNEFNPYRLTTGWTKFWLETTSQPGKYLRLHIGRAASAEASVQITASAARSVFYTVKSDKDVNFTGAIIQNAKEDENLTGLLSNKIRVVGVSLQSDQSLHYKVLLWAKDSFDDTDLDLDAFCGEIDCDFTSYGFQIGGTGQYYLDIRGVDIDYEDEDASNELHLSLFNSSATSKNAGSTGEVKVTIYYEPRA